MTDWTEPDRSEERWSQPWEEAPFGFWAWLVGDGWEDSVGPEFMMAADEMWINDMTPYLDNYAPRARWVSDR